MKLLLLLLLLINTNMYILFYYLYIKYYSIRPNIKNKVLTINGKRRHDKVNNTENVQANCFFHTQH